MKLRDINKEFLIIWYLVSVVLMVIMSLLYSDVVRGIITGHITYGVFIGSSLLIKIIEDKIEEKEIK